MVKWWTEGERKHRQGCIMWRGSSFGFSRGPERALINALKKFPKHMEVMWMITPTPKGVNVDAIHKTHFKQLRNAQWYDRQGNLLFQCMEKHLGVAYEGLPFMARDVNGIWGPTVMSMLWHNLDWD